MIGNILAKVRPTVTASRRDLIPVESYLHRVFPVAAYENDTEHDRASLIFKPRADCDEFPLKQPVDWEAISRMEDRNWRMQLQGWTVFHSKMIFFDTYAGKEIIVQRFFELASDWWDNYGEDPDDIVTTRMPDSYAWYDMSVGFRALIIAFFQNRISFYKISITDSQATFLKALAIKHSKHLSNPATFSLNNHGMFQAQGLMALEKSFKNHSNDGEDHQYYALDLMERLVTSQFDQNGIHLEHSPHYHFYALSTFEAAMKSGWYDDSEIITERISAAINAKKWLVDPLRRPISVGDSILTVQKSITFPQTDSLKPIVSAIEQSGYAIARSPWNTSPENAGMVFLIGGYHTRTHKHRDCLSFEWFDRGQRVICDGGKYGYKSDRNRHYALSYKAHNNAEIEGFDIIKIKPYGSGIEPSKLLTNGLVQLSGKLDFPAIKHHRKLYVKLGQWMIVEDHLNYAKARETTLWFHMETDFRLVSQSGGLVEAKGSNERPLFIECTEPSAIPELHFGNETDMKGFVSTEEYVMDPALQVGFKIHGSKHKIYTIIALDTDALSEARRFIKLQFGVATTPARLDELFKNALPNITHHLESESAAIELKAAANTYSTIVEDIEFNFFCHRKSPKNDKLLVMFPGASARKNGHLDFQRFGWSEDFDGYDVIAFSDPTLKPSNDIGLAWFQHHKDKYGIDALEKLLKGLFRNNGYKEKNICLFGSSGGGFVSLQLADAFPAAKIIAINPQLFLQRYSRPHYQKMLETCYPDMSSKEVLHKYRDRIVAHVDFQKRDASTFIFQNTQDVSHLERHLRPFLKSQDGAHITETIEIPAPTHNKLNVILFDDEASGHSPPDRPTTVSMILPLLTLDNAISQKDEKPENSQET